jgi:hypothetical protein
MVCSLYRKLYNSASSLNFDVKNLALGGASNARIFRTTLEYFNVYDANLVVIGWTFQDRAELTHNSGLRLRLSGNSCLPDSSQLDSDLSSVHKFWTTNLYNQYLNYYDWIHSILHLQNYFEVKRIKYFFFTALGDDYIYEFLNGTNKALELAEQAFVPGIRGLYKPSKEKHLEYKELQKLTNKINLDRWIGKAKYSMNTYLADNGFKVDQTKHYRNDGHAYWANHIQEYIS